MSSNLVRPLDEHWARPSLFLVHLVSVTKLRFRVYRVRKGVQGVRELYPFADLSNSPFYLLWILHLWVMHSLHLCCVCVFKNLKKRVLLIVNSPHRRSRKYTYGSRTAFSDDRSLFFLIMSNWLWIWYTGSYSEHYCCSHFSPAAFNICFDFYTDMEYWTSRGGLVRDCTFAFLMF